MTAVEGTQVHAGPAVNDALFGRQLVASVLIPNPDPQLAPLMLAASRTPEPCADVTYHVGWSRIVLDEQEEAVQAALATRPDLSSRTVRRTLTNLYSALSALAWDLA